MKNDRLIPGVILVLIGLAFLFHSLWHIHIHWMNLIGLWPIFLIIAGVNLLFVNRRSPLATTIKLGVIIAGFGLVLFSNFGNRFNFPYYFFSWSNDDTDTTDSVGHNLVKISGVSNFNLPYAADAKTAELNITGAGASYSLNDTTSELFTADTRTHVGDYELSHSSDGSKYVLDFNIRGHKNGHFNWHSSHDDSSSVNFKLNKNPIWSIYFKSGAASVDLDLSPYKVSAVTFESGMASTKVKLGQPLETTEVTVSAGMASVEIDIPQNAACRINSDTGLASDNFDNIGFTKTDDGHYETPGYENAKNKMIINIKGGLADFNVNRY